MPQNLQNIDYSYGMLLQGRHGSVDNQVYRYGFQGQERDDEIKGDGNSYNYKYRMHDPRSGRFFAVDPLAPEYPYYTPYQFSGNNPIGMFVVEGLEGIKQTIKDKNGNIVKHVITLNVAILMVETLDSNIKKDLQMKHGKKIGRRKFNEIKEKRVISRYSSYDLKKIEEGVLNRVFDPKKNSKGELVEFNFNVTELRVKSNELRTRNDLAQYAILEKETESSEKLDFRPIKYPNGTLENKVSPLNIIKSSHISTRGLNSQVFTTLRPEDMLNAEAIGHETLHQLLTRSGYEEHKLITELSMRITPKVVDAILEDAIEAQTSDNSGNDGKNKENKKE